MTTDSPIATPPQEACREALLPCPLCGSQAELSSQTYTSDEYESRADWQVSCHHCHLCLPPTGNKYRAIAAWNTRHPSLDDAGCVEAVMAVPLSCYYESGDELIQHDAETIIAALKKMGGVL